MPRGTAVKLSRLALLATFALAVQGCGGTSDADQGALRLINASADAAGLDLYNGSSRIASGVAANAASTYFGFDKGSFTFNLKPAGSGTTSASASVSVDKGQNLSLVAYNSGGALKTNTIVENESAPAAGSAKFRVFNTASVEAGSLDVYLTGAACSALATNATPVAATVSGLQATFSEIGAAGGAGTAYRICVTGAGDKTDLRLEVPAATLINQQVVTLILTASRGGVLVHGLMQVQRAAVSAALNGAARVRLVADAAGAATVSASLNGVSLGSSVTSPAVGTYRLVPAGALTSLINIGATALADPGLSASAGADLTLLVAGSAGTPTLVLLNDDNTPSPSATLPVKLRFVNGLNGVAGGVTLTLDNIVVADSIGFGSASAPVQVAASNALADFSASLGATDYWTATAQSLSANRVYSVFLLGDAAGTPRGLLRVDR
jgi:Domain of unknown function (DUF4397)